MVHRRLWVISHFYFLSKTVVSIFTEPMFYFQNKIIMSYLFNVHQLHIKMTSPFRTSSVHNTITLTSPCSTLSVNSDNKTIFLCHPVILQSHTDICNWAGICSHVWHVIPLNHLCCNICDWFVSLPHHTLDIPWKEWWPSLSYRILRWH